MNTVVAAWKVYFLKPKIHTYNFAFWLHSVFTPSTMFALASILTLRELVGEPIMCLNSGVDKTFVNRYCWISTTFTVPGYNDGAVYPGVNNNGGNEEDQKHYNYYQWVFMVMSFQACAFLIPKRLWSSWEGGLMRALVMDHSGWLATLCRDEQKKAERKAKLVEHLVASLNTHNCYAFGYWFAEALCLFNILLQIYLMNVFFQGDFIAYGWNVLNWSDAIDPSGLRDKTMALVFPYMTKCTFRKFGFTGSIEVHDALCVLPLNAFNEKSYLFLWFWLIALAIVFGLLVVIRIVVAFFPVFRRRLINFHDPSLQKALMNMSTGDWWVIYMLGKNVDSMFYAEVLSEFASKKREKMPVDEQC